MTSDSGRDDRQEIEDEMSESGAAGAPEAAPRPGTFPSDRELADRILKASNKLQNAVDDAIGAGLIAEPAFTRIEGRTRATGSPITSYICNVALYRKLT